MLERVFCCSQPSSSLFLLFHTQLPMVSRPALLRQIMDGLAPLAKGDETNRRRVQRCDDATAVYDALCNGPLERVAAIHPTGHVPSCHKHGEGCGDRRVHPQPYPERGLTEQCKCCGTWCPGDFCYVSVSTVPLQQHTPSLALEPNVTGEQRRR